MKKPTINVKSRSALGGWTVQVLTPNGSVLWQTNADTAKDVTTWLEIAAQWRNSLILALKRGEIRYSERR